MCSRDETLLDIPRTTGCSSNIEVSLSRRSVFVAPRMTEKTRPIVATGKMYTPICFNTRKTSPKRERNPYTANIMIICSTFQSLSNISRDGIHTLLFSEYRILYLTLYCRQVSLFYVINISNYVYIYIYKKIDEKWRVFSLYPRPSAIISILVDQQETRKGVYVFIYIWIPTIDIFSIFSISLFQSFPILFNLSWSY